VVVAVGVLDSVNTRTGAERGVVGAETSGVGVGESPEILLALVSNVSCAFLDAVDADVDVERGVSAMPSLESVFSS
jgi:hypothetical protein